MGMFRDQWEDLPDIPSPTLKFINEDMWGLVNIHRGNTPREEGRWGG